MWLQVNLLNDTIVREVMRTLMRGGSNFAAIQTGVFTMDIGGKGFLVTHSRFPPLAQNPNGTNMWSLVIAQVCDEVSPHFPPLMFCCAATIGLFSADLGRKFGGAVVDLLVPAAFDDGHHGIHIVSSGVFPDEASCSSNGQLDQRV